MRKIDLREILAARAGWIIAVALALAPLSACRVPRRAPAQHANSSAAIATAPAKEQSLAGKFPGKPSLPPTFTIPIGPLGFTAPGQIYLGARNSIVSLDFIDENRLLFTFRIPGLLRRDTANGEESGERQIRAVVLALPQGSVQAQASWTVHDRTRYLWMLSNGHFLLRDRNHLLEGDATLKLKPFLDFPGPLLRVDLDPEQNLLLTISAEPAAEQKPAAAGQSSQDSGSQVSSPSTASAGVATDDADNSEGSHPDFVVRILRRDSGEVMLVSRASSQVRLPINTEGYLENLRGQGTAWVLNLSYFTGGSKMLGSVDSACAPDDAFVSEQEILVTGCTPAGESKLMAMTTAGRTLWIARAPATQVWPQLTVAPNGSRLAWETLDSSRSINSYATMDADDIKEQSVTVFDAATGDIALVSPLSPMLDAGGNVAISPSGRRVALLNAGAIQIFELPEPPPLPTPTDPLLGK